MINAKELGFLFGYLEKSAGPKILRGAFKANPNVLLAKLLQRTGATRKPIRPLVGQPKPAITKPVAAASSAAPVVDTKIRTPEQLIAHEGLGKRIPPAEGLGQTVGASPAEELGKAVGALPAEGLGQAVGASPAEIIPWNERMHQATGIQPKTWSRGAGLGLGLLAGKLVNDSVSSERDLAFRREMAMMNPFMYGQPYGQPGMTGQPGMLG